MAKGETREIIDSLHPLEIRLLFAFEAGKVIDDSLLISRASVEQAQKDMAIGWLLAKGIVEVTGETVERIVALTEIGERYRDQKTPELRIYETIRQTIRDNRDVNMSGIREREDLDPTEISSAIGALKDKGIVRIAQGGRIEIADESPVSEFEDIQTLITAVANRGEVNLSELSQGEQVIIEGLHRKRGKTKGVFRINEKVSRTYTLTDLGTQIHAEVLQRGKPADEISQLTPEMLKDASWEGKSFRRYNITLPPPRMTPGRKHPYKEFLDSVKDKLVAMGFEEMRGGLVENEFWNMDALYMPQFHPARDIHDVYYVKGPESAREIEEPFLANVSKAHYSGGDTGSRGWQYCFDVGKAKRLMLRSQGTAVSARTLANNPKIPGKYFSIARCFRYEQVDATHAQDFFQIEGIVLGEEINFRTLLGLLELFAREVAKAKEIEFLPAYFPFTEPSVELHVKHPKLGWMELGGAGIFRPEVTIPLGVHVPVIAWGLGLDRMAMVALDIHDIRDLFSANLDMIRTKRTHWL
ncbi:MAG: phenylalanine--tRNA ligase subunit alpha [Nitrospirae bacterium]|nr:phenylalanine--tRNA ligase subunit alpha [Nitrospirota bacterium]